MTLEEEWSRSKLGKGTPQKAENVTLFSRANIVFHMIFVSQTFPVRSQGYVLNLLLGMLSD